MNMFFKPSLWALCLFAVLASCKTKDDQKVNSLFFSVEDDLALGQKVAAQIEADTSYKILSETAYPEAYSHIQRITNQILNSGKIQYRDEFAWQVKLIHDDEVLNAFCAPGGYIYVYTGIIKFLDNEDQLAGVMAHEIAHADRRHVIKSMEKRYGISVLFEIVAGKNESLLAEIAQGLIGLSFSRTHETDADTHSVIYLCETEYQSSGAAGFFEKLLEAGAGGGPAFLSTHPSPDNRVENINNQATTRGCSVELSGNNYTLFKNSLP